MLTYWFLFIGIVTASAVVWLVWEFFRMQREARQWEREMIERYGHVPTISELMERSWISDLELARRKVAAAQRARRQRRTSKVAELSRYHKALDILPGYVYLLRDTAGMYKIGLSKDVPSRVRNIQRRHPRPITIVHTVASKYTHHLEHALHHRFHHRHAYGEWFHLSADDAAFVCGLADNLDREAIAALWPPAPPVA